VPHGDGASVALVVEGGAMRGVISAGMVSALEHLNMTDAFDAVYGSSAGAINAAYFLAGQAALGTSIYYEDINNAEFISWSRLLSRRPVLDLSFLLDDVADRRKRLDAGRVLGSAAPLTVLATAVEPVGRAILRGFTDREDLVGALRASATMPVVAGGPSIFRGERYLDASLTEPIPVPTAEADGHTHVLVLLTRPGETARRVSLFDRVVVLPELRRISAELAARYVDRGVPYADLLRSIGGGRGPLGQAVVTGLRPDPPAVGKLERRGDALRAAAQRGFDSVVAAFQ
jgi:predicted patatin/cPLA2 family phospholipase